MNAYAVGLMHQHVPEDSSQSEVSMAGRNSAHGGPIADTIATWLRSNGPAAPSSGVGAWLRGTIVARLQTAAPCNNNLSDSRNELTESHGTMHPLRRHQNVSGVRCRG